MTNRLILSGLLWLLSLLTLPAAGTTPLVKYTEYRSGETMAHTRVSCFHQDGQGFLWMGTWIGLCRYDGQEFHFFRSEPGNQNPQSHNRVVGIGETSDGRLWCRNYDDALYFFDRETCTFSLINDSVAIAEIGTRHQPAPQDWSMRDNNGFRWRKMVGGSLGWLDTETDELHPIEEALSGQYQGQLPIEEYHVLFTDDQKNLWVSAGSALFCLTMQQRQTEFVALPQHTEVRSLMDLGDGTLLIGDKSGYLTRLSLADRKLQYLQPDGHWTTKQVPFAPKGIYSLLKDHRGRLWIGTRGVGLFRLDERGLTHYIYNSTDPTSLSGNDVYDIMEDSQQRLWIATFEQGGLNLMSETEEGDVTFVNRYNEWKDYPEEAASTRCLIEANADRILVGTNGGLLQYDITDNHWQRWTHEPENVNSLPGNTVISLFRSPVDGTMYELSYGYSISRISEVGDSLSFDYIVNRDFPAGDVAISATVDPKGRVWYGSECGFTCYTPGEEKPLAYYNNQDLDDNYVFAEVEPLALADGQVFMGMKGGVLTFDGNRLQKSQYTPRLRFTHYGFPALDEQEHYICDMEALTLAPDHRTVSIHFSSLEFQSSPLKRYAYKLVDEQGKGLTRTGTDKSVGWSHTRTPEVNFVELPAGNYVLTVRSTNADGVWCNNEHTLKIVVTPTFWETPWAWLVWGLLFVALASLIGYVAFYINRLEQRRMQLEAVLAEYTNPSQVPPVKEENPAGNMEQKNESHHGEEAVKTAMAQMQAPETHSYDQIFMRDLMNYLEAHLSDSELSVSDIAGAMHMSQATFYRKLKNYVGLSPLDFLRKVRMRRAVQLFNAGEESISQVAYQVGFSDPKYFSKCFKHDMGVSPIEFRQGGKKE